MRSAAANLEDLGGQEGQAPLPAQGAFVLEVRVGPSHVHHLVVEPSGYRYASGPAPDPDAWLTLTAELADALRDGVVPIANAVQSGGIRIGGNLGGLLEHQGALRAVVEHATGDTLP